MIIFLTVFGCLLAYAFGIGASARFISDATRARCEGCKKELLSKTLPRQKDFMGFDAGGYVCRLDHTATIFMMTILWPFSIVAFMGFGLNSGAKVQRQRWSELQHACHQFALSKIRAQEDELLTKQLKGNQ